MKKLLPDQDDLRSHQAALEVRRQFVEEGKPYALYLRKWDIDILHAGTGLIESQILDALSPEAALLTVNDTTTHNLHDTVFARRAPAFMVQDRTWQTVVPQLIEGAQMVVAEFQFLSEGVKFELDRCLHARRDKTVLIVPPHQGPFSVLDNDEAVAPFPRVIHYDELPENAAESFVFRDLIVRLKQIATADAAYLQELSRTDGYDEAFPMDSTSVVEGYQALAANWEAMKQLTLAHHALLKSFLAGIVGGNPTLIGRAALEMGRFAARCEQRDVAHDWLNKAQEYAREAANDDLGRAAMVALGDLGVAG